MYYDEAARLLRTGQKIKRPSMKNAYLEVRSVCNDTNGGFVDRIIAIINGNVYTEFSLSNKDLSADDWGEYPGIKPSPMYAERYYVRCPNCQKAWSVGQRWVTLVGDISECECGCKVLLEPPVEFQPTDISPGEAAVVNTNNNGCKKTADQPEVSIWRPV